MDVINEFESMKIEQKAFCLRTIRGRLADELHFDGLLTPTVS